MDLVEIRRLTAAVESAKKIGFTVQAQDSTYFSIDCAGFKYLSKETARAIAEELNAAVAPIVKRLEAQLRRELAKCARTK